MLMSSTPLPLSLSADARWAGGCYLLTILLGMTGAFLPDPVYSAAATLLSFGFYLGVTLFLYRFFAAVNRKLSLLAAGFSLAGCIVGILEVLELAPAGLSSLVFFGCYCLLTSYLIWHSGFMPRWLGGLLGLSGLGWLVFLSPQLVHLLSPYPMVTGLLGEGALTYWLLLRSARAIRGTSVAGSARAVGAN